MDVHVNLAGCTDLTGEIYCQLRAAILTGRLQPGHALPPTRELARSLSVSRTTVTEAYGRLWGEGLVTSRTGSGTYVERDGVDGLATESPHGHAQCAQTATGLGLDPASAARPNRGAVRLRRRHAGRVDLSVRDLAQAPVRANARRRRPAGRVWQSGRSRRPARSYRPPYRHFSWC